ncbi:MAG TPA: VWA domain-containing protein, partial [Thermoanaerobaculia bacterium]|nr:VWA domain-containing protein [Thermoanaerobaculia bacterium]
MPKHLAVAVLPLLLLAAAPCLTQSAAPPARLSVPIEVTDAKGRPVDEVSARDLELLAGGVPRPIAAVSPIVRAGEPGPWRIAIYFDRVTTGTPSLRAAAAAIEEQLPALTALGEVELYVAEPEPRALLPATRAVEPLDEVLSQLFLEGEGRDDLRQLRARFATRKSGGQPGSASPADPADPADTVRDPADASPVPGADEIEQAFAAEVRTAIRQQDRLLELLAASPPGGPRALFLISDGYDRNPAAFYGAGRPSALERASVETARAAAALGWTVFTLRLGDEKLPDLRRFQLGSGQGNIGARVTLPNRPKGAPKPEPEVRLPPLGEPEVPLRRLAEATGGAFAARQAEVAAAVEGLARRRLLSWEEPDLPAGTSVPIEVRALGGRSTIRAPAFAGSGVPGELAAARARALLSGDEVDGAFPIGVEVRRPEGASPETAPRLEVRLEETERSAGAGSLRGTLLDELTGAPVALPSAGWNPASGEPLVGAAPTEAGPVAIVLDDPATGRFGAALVDREDREASEVQVSTSGPAGAERPAAGEAARSRRGFTVRIVKPGPGPAEGPVEVEAEVRAPKDARIERVEFSWNDELAATAYAPPWIRRVAVPRGGPVGFVRVAAFLADGSTTDDAVLVNAGVPGARVDVRLVEVPVVVTDRDGHPVRGLAQKDFRLLRAGKPQEIASFGDVGDLPLTLGLAVDSSASMFLKLPRVERAARTLLARELSSRDRALLVDFDSAPHLLARPTRDLGAIASALEGLHADGGTALW